MSGLSLLASCAPSFSKNVRYGYVFNEKTGRDEYEAIPSGGKTLSCTQAPSHEMIEQLAPLLAPTAIEVVRDHIGRLALLKRIGSASEATMPMIMSSMAFEIVEFSQLAILMAFRQIKRDPSPWMPTIGEIILKVDQAQDLLDAWLDLYRRAPEQALIEASKAEAA